MLFNQHSPTNLKEFACVKTETQIKILSVRGFWKMRKVSVIETGGLTTSPPVFWVWGNRAACSPWRMSWWWGGDETYPRQESRNELDSACSPVFQLLSYLNICINTYSITTVILAYNWTTVFRQDHNVKVTKRFFSFIIFSEFLLVLLQG